jgi:outer membrane protein
MKKFLLVGVTLFLGGALAVEAQEGQAGGGGARDGYARIAVIDMQRVLHESLLGKEFLQNSQKLQAEYQADVDKKQKEVEKLNEELQAMQQDLQKQASVLSEEAVEEKQMALRRKEREAQATVFDYQQEMQRKENSLKRELTKRQSEVGEQLRPHIESVYRERQLDILVDRAAVAFMSDAFDISAEVIRRADEGFSAGAGKPAAEAKP